MDVIDYVREEVTRQGHDVFAIDGIERVGWMLEAWCVALQSPQEKPEMGHVILLGKMVERFKNRRGLRTVDVYCRTSTGIHKFPPAKEVSDRLTRLFSASTTAMEFYKEFELIHPFVDGNGRTGKILLNWLNGTLLDPIFPPADLFGEPIRNP